MRKRRNCFTNSSIKCASSCSCFVSKEELAKRFRAARKTNGRTGVLGRRDQGARALRGERRRPAGAGYVGRRTQGASSGGDRLSGLRAIAPAPRQQVQRPAQTARPEEFPVSVGGRFSDVRVERRGQPLGGGAPPLHLGTR